MRKLKLLSLAAIAAFALVFTVNPVLAELPPFETSTKTIRDTTITWDSSFKDCFYTLGEDITMTVEWTVDAGTAEFKSFGLKEKKNLNGNGKAKGPKAFTPRGNDPAEGALIRVTPDTNEVVVNFRFTELHFDEERNVEIGNAHFKLFLMVDEDGDEIVETQAGFGVNVHVEDPQDATNEECLNDL